MSILFNNSVGDTTTPLKKVSFGQKEEDIPRYKRGQRGSISISVRLSSNSSASSLGVASSTDGGTKTSSVSSVPSITLNTAEEQTTSPDENKGMCLLPDDDCELKGVCGVA